MGLKAITVIEAIEVLKVEWNQLDGGILKVN